MSHQSSSNAWTFVRHGQSTANAGGWLAGHVDAPLTELGREQAVALAGTLGGVGLCSDLQRAHRTALLAGLQPTVDARLRERYLGDWEGCTLAQLRRDDEMRVLHSWAGRPPNGESNRDVALRTLRVLAELNEPTVVVAHGGVIRSWIGLLDGVDHDQIGRIKVANATPIRREILPGRIEQLISALAPTI